MLARYSGHVVVGPISMCIDEVRLGVRRDGGWSHRAARYALLGLVLAVAGPLSAAGQPVSEPLGRQIAGLMADKATRTPVQRKLSSQLIYAARMERGEPPAPGVATLRTWLDRDAAGKVLIDIDGEITPVLSRRLEQLGGVAIATLPARRALRARLPLARIETLAALPEVVRIREADPAFTHKVDTSEGDGAHFADDARASLGLSGSGVKVGVLSDGVDSRAAMQASGDLPAVTVLPGQAGSGDEGTAMLEIVHDLAPGASLLFATAFTSQASFANNIIALRNAGANVIVDDVGYFAEGVFQDDDVAAAVDQVVADGAIYLSAAGNSGNLNDGTAGVWEGDWVAGPLFDPNGPFPARPAHDFGAGDFRNRITLDSPSYFTLQWSDPLLGSGNDYDLLLVNSGSNTLMAASTSNQDGNDDPFEIIGSTTSNDTNRELIVVLYSGSGRYLHLNANRGRLEHATAGQTWGHAAAHGALGVAAVDARTHTAGFTGSEPVEYYSSDGPRRVFYAANGAAYTPGNVSSTGGELRQKPDIAGADCVDTNTPGFNLFCGTSAAAPHVGAVAALLIERGGGPGVADPADVHTALASTALDIEAPGTDRDSGAGIAHALAAANAMPTACTTNGQCDDGVFCNGAETCAGGSCTAGAPPACSGGTPFCNEALDACTACLGAGDCSDGLYCNGSEVCSAGSCGAGAPPACGGATPFCDEAADACVQCLGAGDCSDGLYCNGSEVCSAGSCGAGALPACGGATPFCDEAADACVQCLGAGDCSDGLYCNGSEVCSAGSCGAGSAPLCQAPTPFCDDGADACVQCLVDADCGNGGVCHSGVCQSPPVPAWPLPALALAFLALLASGWLALRRARVP